MKDLTSAGCGYCLHEHSCKKRIELINERNIDRDIAFYKAHTCDAFIVDPKVGKTNEEIMIMNRLIKK